jgi:hypothetical protein
LTGQGSLVISILLIFHPTLPNPVMCKSRLAFKKFYLI